jgi:ATP-binding cassette subfamily F protein 3
MSVVVLENISITLGGRTLFENLSLRLAEENRVGLIGPNGSGKTTLMRILAGASQPDGGAVRPRKGARIAYLPQDVTVGGGRSLMTFIRESVPGRKALEKEIAETEAALAEAGMDTDAADYEERMIQLGGRVGELHERLADYDRFYGDHEAQRILAGLGFADADHDRDLGELSGGWKMRAVLCSLLFQRPDLLLLDEPTNHLDMPSVAWLSEFLQQQSYGLVLISHDREFLNEQINRVVSFEPEGVRQYEGDLDSYARQREEERVLLENRARNLQKEKEHLEQFVRRFRAKASKAAAVQSRVKRLEKMGDIELHQEHQVMSFRFPEVERAGKVVLEVDGLNKSYGDHRVLEGVNLKVMRGQRIGLLGVNGAGKTTLLRILAEEIEPSGGVFEFGHKTKVGYYAQHHAEALDGKQTVYEAVASCAKGASNQQIRGVLGAMLFGEREIDKRVAVLSGGERARVALAQLLIDPGNVLLMDEPTNHLDLQSSERLAEALRSFGGTLLFVSHNRAFVRALAKQLWFVEDGKVVPYPGTLDDYLVRCRLQGEEKKASIAGADDLRRAPGATGGQTSSGPKEAKKSPSEPKTSGTKSKAERRQEAAERRERRKRLRPLERRAAELEKRIAKLEKQQAKRSATMADPAFYEGESDEQAALSQEFGRAQAELEVAMETWTEVQEELETARAELESA